MPTGRNRTTQGIKPQMEDVLEFIRRCQSDDDIRIRYTTLYEQPSAVVPRLKTVIQLYILLNDRPWIEHERSFLWPNSEGREYTANLLVELHRAFHVWDTRSKAH